VTSAAVNPSATDWRETTAWMPQIREQSAPQAMPFQSFRASVSKMVPCPMAFSDGVGFRLGAETRRRNRIQP
jgi:hypothetical protein